MADWAGKFSDFGSRSNNTSYKRNTSHNNSFKFRPKYTPLNETSGLLTSTHRKQTIVTPKSAEPVRQNFNFRSEKVAAIPVDDWEDDDFDFDTVMDKVEDSKFDAPQSQEDNQRKISDEELQEMTMALMNDDDWDLDVEDEAPPAPMDAAKVRLNQTTAVLGAPSRLVDFFDDGPKPEEIIQNLKEDNKKKEKMVEEMRTLVETKEEERHDIKVKLDLKSKELEKEMRIRKNLEANLRKEVERAHKAVSDKDKELEKLKRTAALKAASRQENGEASPSDQAKKRKRSASSLGGGSPSEAEQEDDAPRSVFNPLEGLDLQDFFLEQFALLGTVLQGLETSPRIDDDDEDNPAILRIT